ncbi:MAG: hypothetical protein HYR67_18550 [Bacteroidetes bacterium]|nr:hypothetical protein [Bacteroidota bacterium]
MKKTTLFLISITGIVACSKHEVTPSTEFTLQSEAVASGKLLDAFKCETKILDVEKSIPLSWSNVPASTGSLAIVMYHYPNPDDHSKDPNTYLFLWNINPSVLKIEHGAAGDGPWYMGPNKDHTAISYTSPCSPSSGTHHYIIKLYALNKTPGSFPAKSTLDMTWTDFQTGIGSVSTIGTATLEFDSITN